MDEQAECTLADFLNGPEVGPPSEWVTAVTRRGNTFDEQDGLAERAREARERADDTEQRIARLRAARGTSRRDDEATGILVAAFNVEADRAFECLLWVAEQSRTPLPTVTRKFVARVHAMGADGHNRNALIELLSELAEASVEDATG